MTDFFPIIAQFDSSALNVSYLAIGPELLLAFGAAYLAPRIARREAEWRKRNGLPSPWLQ